MAFDLVAFMQNISIKTGRKLRMKGGGNDDYVCENLITDEFLFEYVKFVACQCFGIHKYDDFRLLGFNGTKIGDAFNDLLKTTSDVVATTFKNEGIEGSDVKEVVFCGGPARIYAIKELLTGFLYLESPVPALAVLSSDSYGSQGPIIEEVD